MLFLSYLNLFYYFIILLFYYSLIYLKSKFYVFFN
ncbi:Uncharacterised protein [Yersinia kristensenii]|nr:Uncharacterised protein [Yersinia kristensenii]